MSAIIPIISDKSKKSTEATNSAVMAENVRNPSFPESKYTDPTPTSSASFKPPRSKESMLKNKTQPPQSDGWFSAFSYIKTMFTGKGGQANSAQNILNDPKKNPMDKKSHSPKMTQKETKKTEIVKAVSNEQDKVASGSKQNPTAKLNDSKVPTIDKSIAENEKTIKSSFGFSTKETHNSVDKEKSEHDPQQDTYYTPIRFVDNRSTYLHAPDKKGTTSFRITTGPKVAAKPLHASQSPKPIKIVSNSKHVSPQLDKLSRKKSSSPTRSVENSHFRQRSKSTPDRTTFKARLVSLSTSQKSLNTKSENIPRISKSLFAENVHTVANVKSSPYPSYLKPTIIGESKGIIEAAPFKPAYPKARSYARNKSKSTKTTSPRMPTLPKLTPQEKYLAQFARKEKMVLESTFHSKNLERSNTPTIFALQDNSSPSFRIVNEQKLKPTMLSQTITDSFNPLQKVPKSPTFRKPTLVSDKESSVTVKESQSPSLLRRCNYQSRQPHVTPDLSQNDTGSEICRMESPARPVPFSYQAKSTPLPTVLTENLNPIRQDNRNKIQPQKCSPKIQAMPTLQPTILEHSPEKRSLSLIPSPNMHLEEDDPMLMESSSAYSPSVYQGFCVKSSYTSELSFNGKMISDSQEEKSPDLDLKSELNSVTITETADRPSKSEPDRQDTGELRSISTEDEYFNHCEECDRSNSASHCNDICLTGSDTSNYEMDVFGDDIAVCLEPCSNPTPNHRSSLPHAMVLNSMNGTNGMSEVPSSPCVAGVRNHKFTPVNTSNGRLNPEDDLGFRLFSDNDMRVNSPSSGNHNKETSPRFCNLKESETHATCKERDIVETVNPAKSTSFNKANERGERAKNNIKKLIKTKTHSPVKLKSRSEDPKMLNHNQSPISPGGSGFLKAISNVHAPTVTHEPTIADEPKVQTYSYLKSKKKTSSPTRKPYDFSPRFKTPSIEEPTVLDTKDGMLSSPDDLKNTVVSAIGSAMETFTEMLKPVLSPRPDTPELKPVEKENAKGSSSTIATQNVNEESLPKLEKPLSATIAFISNFLEEHVLPSLSKQNTDTEKQTKANTKNAQTGKLSPTSSPPPPPFSTSPALFKKDEKNKQVPTIVKTKLNSPVLGPTILTDKSHPGGESKHKSQVVKPNVKILETSPQRSNEAIKQKDNRPGPVVAKKETQSNVSPTSIGKHQAPGNHWSEKTNSKTSAIRNVIPPTVLENIAKKPPEKNTITKQEKTSGQDKKEKQPSSFSPVYMKPR